MPNGHIFSEKLTPTKKKGTKNQDNMTFLTP